MKDEIQQILIANSFIVSGTGIKWKFTDNTISVNSSPVTRYSLYEENEKVYLNAERPLFVNEDCLIVYSNKGYPSTVTLSPKSGAGKHLILEVLQ